MLTYHPFFPLWCPTARQKVEWRLDLSSTMHTPFGQMLSRDEQLKANSLRGWKMPRCTDCEGFIWYFITFEISIALLSPSKVAQQQREWMISQNIHYHSLQKCSCYLLKYKSLFMDNIYNPPYWWDCIIVFAICESYYNTLYRRHAFSCLLGSLSLTVFVY